MVPIQQHVHMVPFFWVCPPQPLVPHVLGQLLPSTL